MTDKKLQDTVALKGAIQQVKYELDCLDEMREMQDKEFRFGVVGNLHITSKFSNINAILDLITMQKLKELKELQKEFEEL